VPESLTLPPKALRALGFLVLLSPVADARSEDLLGPYVGGAIGRSEVVASAFYPVPLSPYPGTFKRDEMGFQVMLGIRPISWIGAEITYFDLGHSSGSIVVPFESEIPHNVSYEAAASVKGAGAFGIVYLPIPLIDLYAKIGIARTQSSLAGIYPSGNNICLPNLPCGTNPFQLGDTSIGVAEGGGVQYKLGSWAFRAEYERFNSLGEHPSLLSVGVTWTFL